MVLGLAWLINLFNFMDGIDGIVRIEVCSVLGSAVGYFWFLNRRVCFSIKPAGSDLWAATLGFCFGTSEAKIFMGMWGVAYRLNHRWDHSGFLNSGAGQHLVLGDPARCVWVDASYALPER